MMVAITSGVLELACITDHVHIFPSQHSMTLSWYLGSAMVGVFTP